MSGDDARHMRRALRLARRGWGRVAPNPLVGAVVVRDGAVVGEGWHAEYGGPHAEVVALAAAGDAARGATVYVTLEPCNHWGRTPPCVDALLAAGVSRVVVAAADPHPIASGGAERLRAAGVVVDVGVLGAPAVELNAPFFFDVTGGTRPWITLKLAVSIDGAVADHTREPAWLTGARSRRVVHRMRAGHDAIAVGIGTALADDPALTVRDVPPPRVAPLRVVFDRGARLPATSGLVRGAGAVPTCVVCAPDAPVDRRDVLERAGVRVVVAESLVVGCEALRASGLRSLLVEGGAGLAGALWAADLVDRLVTFQAPVVLGAGALHAFASAPAQRGRGARRLPVARRRVLGDDLLTTYAVHPVPTRPAVSSP
ncbi:riboflavin biosynthesis protein RibD [Gemmatimonadetes bacterium T265]|nr:riboflavin biosynthesis protein RibD [Gemmatimonadetes bacterium T265]